jgi:hypothetical protein
MKKANLANDFGKNERRLEWVDTGLGEQPASGKPKAAER